MITRAEFLQEFEDQMKAQRDYLRAHYPIKHKHHHRILRAFDVRVEDMRNKLKWMVWIPFKPAIKGRFNTLWGMNSYHVFSSETRDKIDNTAALYVTDALRNVGNRFEVMR